MSPHLDIFLNELVTKGHLSSYDCEIHGCESPEPNVYTRDRWMLFLSRLRNRLTVSTNYRRCGQLNLMANGLQRESPASIRKSESRSDNGLSSLKSKIHLKWIQQQGVEISSCLVLACHDYITILFYRRSWARHSPV
jgi:hypothetical protein